MYLPGTGSSVGMPGGGTTIMSEGSTKHYVYDVKDQLIGDYQTAPGSSEHGLVHKYVYQGGRRVLEWDVAAGVKHVMLADPSSDRNLAEEYRTSSSGQVVWPLSWSIDFG
jgi:hypothetical protein